MTQVIEGDGGRVLEWKDAASMSSKDMVLIMAATLQEHQVRIIDHPSALALVDLREDDGGTMPVIYQGAYSTLGLICAIVGAIVAFALLDFSHPNPRPSRANPPDDTGTSWIGRIIGGLEDAREGREPGKMDEKERLRQRRGRRVRLLRSKRILKNSSQPLISRSDDRKMVLERIEA